MNTQFKEGYEYLVKTIGEIIKIKILLVTKTCYYIEFIDGSKKFYEIDEFKNKHILLEELEPKLNIPNFTNMLKH